MRRRGKEGGVGSWHLFHILMWHHSWVHARELHEDLRILVPESKHVAPERHVKRDCMSGCWGDGTPPLGLERSCHG